MRERRADRVHVGGPSVAARELKGLPGLKSCKERSLISCHGRVARFPAGRDKKPEYQGDRKPMAVQRGRERASRSNRRTEIPPSLTREKASRA